MINNKKIIIERTLLIGILGIMFSSFIVAMGLGGSYTSDIPLKMYPGQERDVPISLQNPDISGEPTFKGTLLVGSEIATLGGETYIVPLGESVSPIINVEIPNDAVIGQEYIISVKFYQVAGEGEGGATFSQSMTYAFKVLVVEKPAEPTTPAQPQEISNVWLWVLGIAVLIVIAWIILRKRKSNPVIVKKKK